MKTLAKHYTKILATLVVIEIALGLYLYLTDQMHPW